MTYENDTRPKATTPKRKDIIYAISGLIVYLCSVPFLIQMFPSDVELYAQLTPIALQSYIPIISWIRFIALLLGASYFVVTIERRFSRGGRSYDEISGHVLALRWLSTISISALAVLKVSMIAFGSSYLVLDSPEEIEAAPVYFIAMFAVFMVPAIILYGVIAWFSRTKTRTGVKTTLSIVNRRYPILTWFLTTTLFLICEVIALVAFIGAMLWLFALILPVIFIIMIVLLITSSDTIIIINNK